MSTKHFNYTSLLRQRTVVTALTLGLVVVMFGVGINLIVTSERSTITAPTKKLIAPLDPQLDVATVERLERYNAVTIQEAKRVLRERFSAPVGSPSATLLPTPTLPPSPLETPVSTPTP